MEWVLLGVLGVLALCAVAMVLHFMTWIMEHIAFVVCACLLVGGGVILLSGGFISVDLGNMGGRFSIESGDLPDAGKKLSGLLP